MTMLSKYFSLEEATLAPLKFAGQNVPTAEHLENLTALCAEILDPCREWLGGPLRTTSMYRCPAYNTSIAGDPNSQHMIGQAADIKTAKNAELFHYIRKNLPFDIMIWELGTVTEPAWVHVSYRLPRYGINRRFAKRAVRETGIGPIKYIAFDL